MDKIDKALRKFTARERSEMKKIIKRIRVDDLAGLDVKKLKARDNIFRIRKGAMRIIYRKDGTGIPFVLSVERRTKNTYR